MADLLPLFFSLYCDNYAGGHGGADIPVPVPNTEVKRPSADGTASRRESRPPPAFSFFSSLRPGRAFRARRACFFPLPPLRAPPVTAPPEKVSGGRSRAASSSAPRGALFNVLRRLRGKKPGGCPASAAGESARAVPDKLLPALALRALAALPRWGQQRRRRRSGARRRNGTRSRGQPGPGAGRETPDKKADSLPASAHSCAMPAIGCVSPCVRCGSPASFVP